MIEPILPAEPVGRAVGATATLSFVGGFVEPRGGRFPALIQRRFKLEPVEGNAIIAAVAIAGSPGLRGKQWSA
ncbi:MAG: hypothetical protein WAM06_09845 [Methyloceanibacter sp.]